MITKRNLIETLQNRLIGGDCPDDLKGMYHPQILEQVISGVLADFYVNNPQALRYMGAPRVVQPVQVGSKWRAKSPVPPLSGSRSLLWVYGCDEDDWYVVIQGEVGYHTMKVLKPSRCRVGVYYENGYLHFTEKPSDSVTVIMVPNVSEMGDDEDILVTGEDAAFFDTCFKFLRSMEAQRGEILNNTREDGRAAN
jgi:hypothetical protein